ncbi:MAG TPA: SIMPL domain-containing protein [bacterium]|jgi:hypothetical protein|nr:SIMPL domain-containing protein [bacterium]
MNEKSKHINIVCIVLILIAFGGLGYGIYHYKNLYKKTITVTGTAKADYANQISSYSLTIEYHDADKEKAVEELNNKVSETIDKVKQFGIDAKDIETQSLSIYQREEPYIEDGVTKYRPNDWYASYTINITLRDLSKSIELTSLLSGVENSSLWGPNLIVDEENTNDEELLSKAVENAKDKAERLAESTGAKIGKVLKIEEAADSGNVIYPLTKTYVGVGGGAEGSPIEPGFSTMSKSVIVTFELK